MTDADEQGEADREQTEAAENSEIESTPEAPSEGADEGGDQPDIDPDEQADVPEGLVDIDPAEVEETAGASADEDDADDQPNDDEETDADAMGDPGGSSPAQSGELYVSAVQSLTNANIRKLGDEESGEVDREHFEKYDLADHFNETMDSLGVGSDLEPHEALLLATVLSVSDGLVQETDALDQMLDELMTKAMGAV